ncbi:hypothetical protein CONPUDRAFT_84470 [Coniophora puteana RWD-64-598 SS2]|uniref:DUF7330 domain-containing protein n=1 Tax=Coniophora puteana (strain RWD-64-598) TaxID=741705 RepID=A0A5M3MEL6_CONPW|nr:uncharacterized protein CONPUDRAFT_84470 [Coniophora puteana RWD-64-598 SS2]EIW77360.1 hypothetical protein CONPUDRAFT_84470 [Coniophora puteana RWD-64-598 SS2]
MIIAGEQALDPSKLTPVNDGKATARTEDGTLSDLPPAYSQVASSSQQPLTRHPRTTNYLYISEQYNSLKGSYAIDPSMSIPSSVLPKLEDDETELDRKNLRLRTGNGSINVDILLVSLQGSAAPDDITRNRATLEASSEYGSVNIRLRTSGSVPPFHLKAHSSTGSLTINIPRSFHGFLKLKKQYSSIKLSDELAAESTALSAVDGVSMWFIGDFASFQGEWEGDEVEADTVHGSIKLRYVDEKEVGAAKSGFFSRIFGL